jgi:H+-transporting ATPase
LAAVCGTQVLATLIAVYGAGLVAPLGWKYAGIVWAYACGCFLITDPVKLLTYKVLDTIDARTPAPISPPALAGEADESSHANADVGVNLKLQAKNVPPLESHAATNVTAARLDLPAKAAE